MKFMGRMVPRCFFSIMITMYLTRCFVDCSSLPISQMAFFGLILILLFLGGFKSVPVVSIATPASGQGHPYLHVP